MSVAPRLAMVGVDKSFPGVRALRGASLSVEPGEVHVLLGENGAGKSTLMKILSGQYPPDAGTIALDGVAFAPRSPAEAARGGIAIIHQELSTILPLTVAENILLGDEPARGGLIDARAQERRVRELLQMIGARLDPGTRAADLSVAERQLVEIAKALRHEARLLIMDEPTAALTDAETEKLFTVIRGLTARGVSVVYISHRMPEIFAVGDRVTVLRDGATITTLPVATTTVATLITAMVGRPVEVEQRPRAAFVANHANASKTERLAVEGLFRGPIGPVSFTVRAGEVFALAGLMGSGRTEVARALFGADAPSGGRVQVEGRTLKGTVRDAIDAGVGFVTEDRKALGLVPDGSAAANISLAVLDSLCRVGIIDRGAENALAEDHRQRLHIRLSSVQQTTRTLSGGNQQKVIIARWLAARCQVLILDEPTRGVDVGAKAELYELIGTLAAAGVAILLISSELPEVLALADRIGVMHEGQLAGVLARAEATPERVMALAVG